MSPWRSAHDDNDEHEGRERERETAAFERTNGVATKQGGGRERERGEERKANNWRILRGHGSRRGEGRPSGSKEERRKPRRRRLWSWLLPSFLLLPLPDQINDTLPRSLSPCHLWHAGLGERVDCECVFGRRGRRRGRRRRRQSGRIPTCRLPPPPPSGKEETA